SRAPTTSPPTCATGNRTLTASRTNLKSRHAPNCGRTFEGKSIHQPAPATETVTARTITTSRIPQPTLAIAWPTASRPDQLVRMTSAVIPPSQATKPPCFTISPLRSPPLSQPTVCLHTEAWERQWKLAAIRSRGLPRRFDVERVRCPKPDRHLVGGALLRHQRRVSGFAAEPFVFHKDVRRPLRHP